MNPETQPESESWPAGADSVEPDATATASSEPGTAAAKTADILTAEVLGSSSSAAGTGAWDRILREAPESTANGDQESGYVDLAWSTFRRGLDLTGLSSEELGKGKYFVEFERQLYDLALAVSARVGISDNPRRLLEAVAQEILEQRSYRVDEERVYFTVPKLSTPRELSASGLGLVVLSVAELVRPGIMLGYVHLPSACAVRYSQGDYVLNLVIARGVEGEFLTSESLKNRFQVSYSQERQGVYLRELEVKQLGGLLLHELGEGALRLDRRDLAVQLFRDATGKDAASPAPSLALARIAFQNRELENALAYTEDALQRDPHSFETLEMRARLLRSTAQIGAARGLYFELIRDFPEQAHGIQVATAELEAEVRNWLEAVRHYREAALHESRPQERRALARPGGRSRGLSRSRNDSRDRGGERRKTGWPGLLREVRSSAAHCASPDSRCS
jgi:tetratricopeptide (TPR) repeat protein